ncbi:MAG: phosphotransferase [Amylibacter sp.]|nr:phosphotransferase [Amylibacter sp.]
MKITIPPEVIADRIESFFGERVISISAPGGKSRGSYRVSLQNRSIIVSSRDSLEQTTYEASILKELSKFTNASPKFLGQDNELMFQSDVGAKRLGQHMYQLDAAAQEQMAQDAVAALFDIHRAARLGSLSGKLHHMGGTTDWVISFVAAMDELTRMLNIDPPECDQNALCNFIGTPKDQFVKWDCRAGNAAIGNDGRVRWFDFEYAGIRHGAEDFAWLVADENWPVNVETMMAIIADTYPSDTPRNWQDFKSYLEVYAALHAIKRLILIVNRAKRNGWISQAQALRKDGIGTNPVLGIRLCETGITLARKNNVSMPLVELFEAIADTFQKTIP